MTIKKRIAKNGKEVWRVNGNGKYAWFESFASAFDFASRHRGSGAIKIINI